ETCTLWAAACTLELFKQTYLPLVDARRIARLTLFNLRDGAERDDHCAQIYHKSLLYLVSHAFEKKVHIPLFRKGEPILGMDEFVSRDAQMKKLLSHRFVSYILAPNDDPIGKDSASRARHHGDFDDDEATVKATLVRIVSSKGTQVEIDFPRSATSLRDRRMVMAGRAGGGGRAD
ncbi:MAG TPA: peptidase C1, partial [Gammaproteobacteria bacterium]|nr:peptidase C1 [Gammaproteobacteria bacterium]